LYINNKSISKIVRNENGGNMSLKGSNTTATYLEWAEFQFLIQRLEKDKDYKYCLLIATGVYTGLRISDLLNIKYSDIIGKERLVVTEKKTNKRREIKINKDLRELVERIFQLQSITNSDSYMFINRFGNKPIDKSYVNVQLKRIQRKYRIKLDAGFSTHTFRKTLGRRVLSVNDNSEMSIYLLMELFGHSSPQITKRYLGIRQQEIFDVYDALST
jgi:integrase